MGFKMGETCDGCDAIAKGLKKYENKDKMAKMKISAGEDAKKDIIKYTKDAADESIKVSKKIAGNLKEANGIEGVEIVAPKGFKGIKLKPRKKY